MATVKMTKAEAERRRRQRNEYSLQWKAKHKKKVKEWNKAWYEAKRRIAKAKARKPRRMRHTPSPEAQDQPKAA